MKHVQKVFQKLQKTGFQFDIDKLLRPQSKQKRFAAERLPKFKFGNLGKRSMNVGNVPLYISLPRK